MKPYTHNGITGYTKKQAAVIIGCNNLSVVSRLIVQERLTIVGYIPVPHMPFVARILLSVESVHQCAESYTPRLNGTHMYQVRLSSAQLKAVESKFPQLIFTDLTESRRIKREEL